MTNGGVILDQGPPSQVVAVIDRNDQEDVEHHRDLVDSHSPPSELAEKPAATESSTRPVAMLDDEQQLGRETKAERSRQTGDVTLYMYYFKSLGWGSTIALGILMCGYAVFLKFPSVWVQWWSEAETSDPGVYTNLYVGIYGLFCGLCVLSLILGIFLLFQYGIPKSSIGLHARLLKTVMQAPYWFFVETDIGEILNRFSQDMSLISLQLPFALEDTLFNVAVAIVGAILITIGSKWSAVVIPPLLFILYILQKFYLRTSRQIRLLDLEAKSPLYSYFLQTLQGVVTIRAFGWQVSYARENAALLDNSQRPFYLMYSIQRWLNFVLDVVVAAIATIIMTLATQLEVTSAGALGVSLVNILSFSRDLNYLIRTWTDLETSLGAISRVRSFEAETPCEYLPDENSTPPAQWPSEGKVRIEGLTSSYRLLTPTFLYISRTIYLFSSCERLPLLTWM